MTPENQNPLRLDLEEFAPEEFFIAVRFQDRKIASLYLKGDRQYANGFLEVARRRILVNVAGEEATGPRGRVLRELMQLRRSLQAPAE